MQFLDTVHAGPMNGHQSIEKTPLRLQEITYWKGWSGDMQAYIQQYRPFIPSWISTETGTVSTSFGL